MTPILLTPRRFADDRGWFAETFHDQRFRDLGVDANFVQDNHSYSRLAGTIRGIHFQRDPHVQAKLVRCVRGRIYDVAIDLRRASPTFGQHVAAELSADNGKQLFVPAGYGHAFMTLEDDCEVIYKVDAYYAPESEGGLRWDDTDLAIHWPSPAGGIAAPVLSPKDAVLPSLSDAAFSFDYDGTPVSYTHLTLPTTERV